ncbi:FAD/NAD-P-binding domain-containing protein [Artomyces pyxidatus]|uniref:FAD/NAD-P-binding domain-containing protein n=1 Tax=Artomyces pyxidatus TaxID=48021 RepID=A0ACB8SYL7_9AGAM|nr:FAD/NAD-P-binding domain-containing protein [Artomyces pyxidatus]
MAGHRERDFRVAIVGGGICGLVCAIGLTRAGIKIDIFEAASKYGEIGAGIGLGPNAIKMLRELGVLESVVAHSGLRGPEVRSFEYRMGAGDCKSIYSYPMSSDDLRLPIHRADLLEALAEFISTENATTHFNKRCVDIKPSLGSSSRSIIHFDDGSSHITDVVLGADGVKSAVRQFVIGDEISASPPSFTGTTAYRGLVDTAALHHVGVPTNMTARPVCWLGQGKHLITFPIKGGRVLNVVAFISDVALPPGASSVLPESEWVIRSSLQEMLEDYAEFGEHPLNILKSVNQPSKWFIHGLYPQLSTYVKGPIALLGDAAHAMLPHLGAGAGQGIEDGYLLSRLLGHPETNKGNIEAVLRAYDQVRVPRANGVSRGSKFAGEVYDGLGPSGSSSEGRRADLDLIFDAAWHHDMEADVRMSVDWLTDQRVFGRA